MKVINYGRQFIDKKDINSVVEVLKSQYLTQGPKIVEFEKILKKTLGGKYCSVLSSGTAALHLLGIALGWKKNDIILTTPITFLASSNCILYSEATPSFVDIDFNTGNICPSKLEIKIKKLRKKRKKIKAIIAVDFAGNPCDWKKLSTISKKYKINLINDNCHAIGSSLNKNSKYAIKYADYVTLSFHPVKSITTGEGGAIISKNKEIDRTIKILRAHGVEKKPKQGSWYYEMDRIGFNYRLSDIHCALGISQIKKIRKFIRKRNEIAKYYDKFFKNQKNIKTLKISDNSQSAYHLYPLKINFKKFQISKKVFFNKLMKHNIKLQVHYIPIYKQPFYKKKFKISSKEFPNSEKFYNQEVSLPIFYSLEKKSQNFIIKKIFSLLKI